LSLYNVAKWIGANGKAVDAITDAKSWASFWKDADKNSFKRIAPFQVSHSLGSFSHDRHPQDWQIELPPEAEIELQRAQVGINGYLVGSGSAYDQYRDTIAYTDWMKGKLGIAMVDDSSAVK